MSQLFPVLLLAGAISLAGCEPLFMNKARQDLKLADAKLAERDYTAAVLLYEASLEASPRTAEIHYKLGLIYDDSLGRPLSAMHHFQRYLDLDPKGAHAKDAARFLKDDELKLSASLGHGATVPQEAAVRLKNENLELRKKVETLQNEVQAAARDRAALLKSIGGREALQAAQMQKPLVPGVRTYTVQSGDTLASIARKHYGGTGRWKEIQDANFSGVEGTVRLQPGMVLMVP
jgi:tetratricopeptide (TPR) repeat protein